MGEIDGARFDRQGYDSDLFLRQCTLPALNIYKYNAINLPSATESALKGNQQLTDLVASLQTVCPNSTVCTDYGDVLQSGCTEGQMAGFYLLNGGICVCAILFFISWWKARADI